MYIGPGNADKLVADVKQEIQLQQKSKSLLCLCKSMLHMYYQPRVQVKI